MRIKLLKSCVVRGHDGVKPGDVFDVRPDVASVLIGCKFAVEWREESPAVAPAVIETREPRVEVRDPGFSAENVPQPVTPIKRGKSKLY